MKKRNLSDNFMKLFIILSSIITLGTMIWILIYVISNGIAHVSWEFLTEFQEGQIEGGIFPYIISTLYIIFITILIATPIGIFSAIYLVEYAKPGKIVRIIRFATESLAGIPSIVFGLFGLIFFVTMLGFRWSMLSGALTLSIMVLPTVVRTTEESLKAVPNIYREGSLGLGASKLRTIRKVILPSALPGILTAVILSIGRIIGETAAVFLTAGTAKALPKSIMDGGRTLSVHMYYLAKEGISMDKAYATATVLILVVIVINFIANKLASRLNKKNS